jgi:hypothetical protein
MTVGELEAANPAQQSRVTAMWFFKRLVLGILILVVSLGGLAWLLHTAIDPATGPGPESLLDVMGRLAAQF